MSGTVTHPAASPPELERLHRDIDSGLLLPSRWYSDPAIFGAELAGIHRRAWHFATHTGDLKSAGDAYVRNVVGVPIVLVRDSDGEIRGFVNICRHRGHAVVTDSGNHPKLRCPYHGWTYRLNGELDHAPRSAGDPNFDPAQCGLLSVRTHVWGPMIWVNLDGRSPSFESWIDGMPALMHDRALKVEDHVCAFENSWEINCNWKVFQDNAIECYHCPTAHPELSRVLEMKPDLQQIHVGGRYWIHHTIPFRKGFEGGITSRKTDGVPFNYHFHWIFPTTYLQYAGAGFDIGSLDVEAVDRIRFRHLSFLPPDTPQETLERGRRQLETDPTIHQDVILCNRVQASHASGFAPTNRVLREPEFLLSHFHHLIADLTHDARQ
jgi:choline monooxygenase